MRNVLVNVNKVSFLLGLFIASLFTASLAHATTITFIGSASSGDGPVSGEAIFTTSANHVHVDVLNLTVDPTSAGQLISEFDFKLSGGQTSASALTSLGIPVTPIVSGGGYTKGAAESMSWTIGTSAPSGAIQLCGIADCGANHGGGTANSSFMIIGAPNSSNKYASANSSIQNRDPLFAGFNNGPSQFPSAVASFDFTVNGVTSSSTINSMEFNFGTSYTEHVVPGTVCTTCGGGGGGAVPEPASLLLLGTGLAGLGVWRWKKS